MNKVAGLLVQGDHIPSQNQKSESFTKAFMTENEPNEAALEPGSDEALNMWPISVKQVRQLGKETM